MERAQVAYGRKSGFSIKARLESWGIPMPLFFGFFGLLFFMTGDGVETGFISTFMAEHGAGDATHAGYIITAYGLTVMLSSWLTGPLSEAWGPWKVMATGLFIWLLFDVLFLTIAVPRQDYDLMLVFYGLRGLGYPMFAYAFLVWITSVVPKERLGAAVGWFYFGFTGGLPTFGALVAAGSIPFVGNYGALWVGFALLAAGGALAILGISERTGRKPLRQEKGALLRSLTGSFTIAWTHPKVLLGALARMINSIPIFGMFVFFPATFATEIGFGYDKWLLLVSVMFGTCILANLISGIVSDYLGWQKTVFWLGSIGCSITFLLVYFVPVWAGRDFYWLALLAGSLYGITLSGWVPLSALVPTLAGEHKGKAMGLLNLGAGASAFVGPGIASLGLSTIGPAGVVIVFSALYLVSAGLLWFMRLPDENPSA
jgi:polyol permease family